MIMIMITKNNAFIIRGVFRPPPKSLSTYVDVDE